MRKRKLQNTEIVTSRSEGQYKQDKREYVAFVDSSETAARRFLMFY